MTLFKKKNTDTNSLLIERYVNNQATADEVEVLMQLLRTGQLDESLKKQMEIDWENSSGGTIRFNARRWHRYAAACVAFFMLAFSFWLLRPSSGFWKKNPPTVAVAEDVRPAQLQATLTLPQGKRVDLHANNGTLIIDQGNILDKDQGEIRGGTVASEQTYHTISVPRGGHYNIQLADGTLVALNAGSVLRFPLVFSKEQRYVHLEGEGFFTVKKATAATGDSLPFVVETPKQRILVLGTAFNIHAYADEALERTTLVSGKVQVANRKTGEAVLLAPGQDALLAHNILQVAPSNLKQVLSWKNNAFIFHETPMHQIARELSRWYNVDIRFAGSATDRYNGYIERDVPLSKVIQSISNTGEFTCTWEGNILWIAHSQP
ncbi:FecR family protein [Sphingobacterium griseoflavum]|uniref:Iron dicitrate transporter FecR n=1 Tax=Sphingobacterium griseoflavum TaxID=1474952 RepID=A0ABQ3HWH4_9SPHI|nr:FecR family protein [Sphingobacterium griseoflavum]GHE29903.1 iron dicitrate transporter FecR [Sphingobacterium griseoflavum]